MFEGTWGGEGGDSLIRRKVVVVAPKLGVTSELVSLPIVNKLISLILIVIIIALTSTMY